MLLIFITDILNKTTEKNSLMMREVVSDQNRRIEKNTFQHIVSHMLI